MESQVPKPKHIWSHLYVFLTLQMTWLQPRHVWPDISKDWLRDEYYSKVLFFTIIFIYFAGGWAQVWRLENIFWESGFSFHYVGLGDQTQVLNLGSKHLYLLSHLTRPWFWLRVGCAWFAFWNKVLCHVANLASNLLQSWGCPGIPRLSTFI